nr:hypothetical protein [Tanacetum cinerariifolium]
MAASTSKLTVNSSYLGLRKKYRLSLKNDMPPRDKSEKVIPDKGDLSDYWIDIYFDKDFLRTTPLYTYIRDPMRRLCYKMISYNIHGRRQEPEKYSFRKAEGMKSDARLSGGHFIGRLAHYFGLVSDDGLRGLSVVTHELSLIDIERSMTDQDRFSTWMISFMMQLMEASERTYQAFIGTFRGSFPVVFERRTRQRTDNASTSTAQQQPDP